MPERGKQQSILIAITGIFVAFHFAMTLLNWNVLLPMFDLQNPARLNPVGILQAAVAVGSGFGPFLLAFWGRCWIVLRNPETVAGVVRFHEYMLAAILAWSGIFGLLGLILWISR